MIQRKSFLAAGAGIAAAAVVRGPAKAAQFTYKAATNFATDHPVSVRMNEMFSAIQRESGGRLEIQFFPNSSLGGDAAMFTQLRVGALQFFMISAGNLATVVPPADVANLGFAFKDGDDAMRVMNGPLGDYVRNEIQAKNIYSLKTMWQAGMFEIASGARPIHTPDDMRGFKVRIVESRIQIDLFRTLGATPTPMSFGEVYTALQTKILDGVSAPLVSFEASRFYEVQKYMSMTNHAWSGFWLVANPEAWKNLPSDLQQIVERNNTKYGLLEQRDARGITAKSETQLRGQGMTFNAVDQTPFRAPLKAYYDTWAANFGATEWNLLQTGLGRRLT